MLNDVEFREVQEMARIDKVKIVACDGKSELIGTGCVLHYINVVFILDINDEGSSKK